MYCKPDDVPALHRRAVRLRKAPTVTAALVVAMCGTAGIAQADPIPADGPRTTIDSDGTYAVGTEIAPGTYSSAGPVEDSACYWKRLNGSTVVDNALSKKSQVVQIDSGMPFPEQITASHGRSSTVRRAVRPPKGRRTMWSVN